jgi:hypothetical protein
MSVSYVWAVNVKMHVNSHSQLTPTFCISGIRRSLFVLRPQTKLPRERTRKLRLCGISRKYYCCSPRTKCLVKVPLVPPHSTSFQGQYETDMTFLKPFPIINRLPTVSYSVLSELAGLQILQCGYTSRCGHSRGVHLQETSDSNSVLSG